MSRTKICTKCGKTYPSTVEHFGKNKARKDGLTCACRVCCRKQGKKWYHENTDKARKKARRWEIKNKDRANEYKRQWRKKNWIKFKCTRWNWLTNANLTEDQLQDLLDLQNNQCALCGSVLDIHCHLDHIVPRSLGGSSEIDNLQFLCKECNVGKHDKTVEEYISHCEKVVKFNNL